MEERKVKVTREVWEKTCKKCKKLIRGTSRKHLAVNFGIHEALGCKRKENSIK